MKEKVVELLVYLMSEIQDNRRIADIDVKELQNKGYTQSEITAAFSWIYDNVQLGHPERRTSGSPREGSRRVFHDAEKAVISTEGQGFLLQLTELGLLDDRDFEQVIERAMMSGYEKVSVSELQELVAGILLTKGGGPAGSGLMLNSGDTIH
jgi:uncharacterized protein Smg (DUF494 family)